MHPFDRRAFLGTSFGGLAAALGGVPLLAQGPAPAEHVTFRPATLFLTWQRDPTTTMTVQWVGRDGETDDTTVYYTPCIGDLWRPEPSRAKPYPMTDLRIYRAEVTGLTPGTEYRFRLGRGSPTY